MEVHFPFQEPAILNSGNFVPVSTEHEAKQVP